MVSDPATAAPVPQGLPPTLGPVLREFAGREWLWPILADWLTDGARRLVISGPPGTGKSACAGRIVQLLLADGLVGAPDVQLGAWHFCQARQDTTLIPSRVVEGMARQLLSRLDGYAGALANEALPHPPVTITGSATVTGQVSKGAVVAGVNVGALTINSDSEDATVLFDRVIRRPLARLAADGRLPARVVIVIDALDEALSRSSGEELLNVLGRVTGPDAELPENVRFIVTTRPDRRVLRNFGEPDLDLLAFNQSQHDIAAYIRKHLAFSMPERASLLASQIAAAVSGNFLYARYVMVSLSARPPDSSTGLDLKCLPPGLDQHYRDFMARELTRTTAAWEQHFRPVLTLLAVAEGDGMTREQIAAITGLSLSEVNDSITRLTPYLSFSLTGGMRIYHHSFVTYLENQQDYPVFLGEADAAVVAWYRSRYSHEWLLAQSDGYARLELVKHAVRTGGLDALLGDPGYLAIMDPDAVLGATPGPRPDESAAEQVVRVALAHVRGQPIGTRVAYLELVARQLGLGQIADGLQTVALARPWQARWCRWFSADPHYVVGDHGNAVLGLALVTIDGRQAVVAADSSGTLRVWDLSTARECRPLISGAGFAFRGLSVTESGDTWLAALEDESRSGVSVWNVLRGTKDHYLHTGRLSVHVLMGSAAGRPRIITSDLRDARVWDLPTDLQVGDDLPRGIRSARQAVGTFAGHPVAAHAYDCGDRWLLDIIDLESLELRARFDVRAGRPGDDVADMAMVSVGASTYAVMVITDYFYNAELLLWDVDRAMLRAAVDIGRARSPSIAAGVAANRELFAVGGREDCIDVLEFDGDRYTKVTLRGHNGAVSGVAVTEVAGRPAVLSCGDDGTIRLWDVPTQAKPATGPVEPPGDDAPRYIHAVAAGSLGNLEIVACSRWADRERKSAFLEAYDIRDGCRLMSVRTKQVGEVAIMTLRGVPTIVFVDSDGRLERHGLRGHRGRSESLQSFMRSPWENHWYCLMARQVSDQPLVAIGRLGAAVLNLDRMELIGPPAAEETAGSIAIGKFSERTVVAYEYYNSHTIGNSVLMVFDAVTGQRIGEELDLFTAARNNYYGFEVASLAIGTVDGIPTVVAGNRYGEARLWDPTRTDAVILLDHRGESVQTTAIGTLNGRDLIFTGDSSGALRGWTRDGEPVIHVDIGQAISSIALLPEGRVVIGCPAGLALLEIGNSQPPALGPS
jgi:WD40 repeat protein